ncbi:VWA domain-containing protein [Nocardia otitidiscaviarum]|uniref:vWA domain-containing protein n=1 Tax=Nocardia otitidiscaviarum TaxID=1823 RepID=UPI0004A6C725|nr:VWA domain-containing protein [Nocardia otitidiscaviarum]MBF6132941.1 VWA domain-containing protein [Nocardia otitidiscaviarum]MBF6486336.1 VWA domain-containing protein [Nocardia otitidiscaviarum]
MAQALTKGQNAALPVAELTVAVRTDAVIDIAALLLTADRRVRSDDDFVFFNQPHGPGVRLSEAGGELSFALGAVPADVDAVRVVLTLGDTDDTFGRHGAPVASIRDTTGNPLYEYAIEGLTSESVVIAVELYRRGPAWKVRAVGQGYAGGFAALVTDHGVTVDDAPPAEQPVVRSVPGEARLPVEQRQRLDLSKREVAKVLLVKQAAAERARVVLVIDKTGSMLRLYRDKVVHRVVRRMIPVAIQLDDDGVLEPYLYAKSFLRLPDVTVDQAESWSDTYLHVYGTHGGIDYKPIGASNNEIPIISEVMSTLRPGDAPTLVLFFTDGGFSEKSRIARLMREAAALPAFWQFVGLGQANYGLLRTLDELDGRLVDNAGFFAVDDIDRIDDAELYARLLGEFPAWLTAARAAGVVR